MKRVPLFIIGLFFLSTTVFAEPVYTEKESYQVEALEDGQLQVRKAIRVYKDDVEISKTYYRHVLVPEDNLTNEVKKVKDIAGVVWTEEVINKYKEKMAKIKKNR